MATGVACVLELAHYRGEWVFVSNKRSCLLMQAVRSDRRPSSIKYVSMFVFASFCVDLLEY